MSLYYSHFPPHLSEETKYKNKDLALNKTSLIRSNLFLSLTSELQDRVAYNLNDNSNSIQDSLIEHIQPLPLMHDYYTCPPVVLSLCKQIDIILVNQASIFDSMFSQIALDIKLTSDLPVYITNLHQTFTTIIDEIFSDKIINWGRIIVLHAFAFGLAYHFTARKDDLITKRHINIKDFLICLNNPAYKIIYGIDLTNEIDLKAFKTNYFCPIYLIIRVYLAEYMSKHIEPWITTNGGWESFVEKFCYNKLEEKIWKGLLWTALGLGTLAVLVVVK
ncbi:unnamed protein product [Gordionus sp. m RMFG-2023]